MNLGMTNKTLVKYFLELTETSLTEKQASEAAELIRKKVKEEFLMELEKATDKLDFLNRFSKKWFWTDSYHSTTNWFYNFNRINDSIIKENWDFVKKEFGIEKFQIVEITGKEYETYLHLVLAKKDILSLVKKGTETEAFYYWEKSRKIREITPLKKSIFKKDGTINYNSEIYKKIELSAKSKKIKFVIKRDLKFLIKTIFSLKKTARETVFERKRNSNEEIELKLNESVLAILWLKERTF